MKHPEDSPMHKRLTKHGNSLALVLDRRVLSQLKIDEETRLLVTLDGERLIVSRAPGEARRKRFTEAVRDGNKRYGRALRRLAE
jgi:antitoxin component of MazEF toxin-antitoxin module